MRIRFTFDAIANFHSIEHAQSFLAQLATSLRNGWMNVSTVPTGGSLEIRRSAVESAEPLPDERRGVL